MNSNWDAIVVGAGVSGLTVGTILSQVGKKVLVLESRSSIGGRASTSTKMIGGESWHLDMGTFHAMAMGKSGAIGMAYELGPGRDKLRLQPLQAGMLIHRGNGWEDIAELNKGADREEFKKIIGDILSLSYKEIEEYDSWTFGQWLSQKTSRKNVLDFYRAVCLGLLSFPDFEDMSAGEAIYIMKMSLEAMHSLSSGSFSAGGSINVLKPLAEYIEERGGKVETNNRVYEILTEKGRVKGVEIFKVEEHIELQEEKAPETERLESTLVISTLPVWDLFRIIQPENFLPWYVRIIQSYSNPFLITSNCLHLNLILKEIVHKDKNHRVAFDMPHTQLGQQCVVVSAMDPDMAPPGREFLATANFGRQVERARQNKKILRELFNALTKDLNLLYPEIKNDNIMRSIRSISRGDDGLGRMPYFTGKYRLSHKTPIEGFYLAGDTVRTRGVGVDAAARSGILCANAILDSDFPTFRPS